MSFRFGQVSLFLAILAACIGCASVSTRTSTSPSPIEVVKQLMPFVDSEGSRHNYFTSLEEIETARPYLTPELSSTLQMWVIWLGKATVVVPSNDSRSMIWQMLPSRSIFFGRKALEPNVSIKQRIAGDTVTVTVWDVLKDKTDADVLAKTKTTFDLVKVDGTWRVNDLNQTRRNFHPPSTYESNLMKRLRKDIIEFKKTAGQP